jgi:hypothetical protein
MRRWRQLLPVSVPRVHEVHGALSAPLPAAVMCVSRHARSNCASSSSSTYNGYTTCSCSSCRSGSSSSPPDGQGPDFDWGNVPDMPGGLAAMAGLISIGLGIMLNLFGYKMWKCETDPP